jgi:hypothetical protein
MKGDHGLQAQALERAAFAAYINDMAESTATPDPAPAAGQEPTPPADQQAKPPATPPEPEFGGPPGPEPTRYGDWERGGRCIDF